MKHKLNLYCDLNTNIFNQFFRNYNVSYFKITDLHKFDYGGLIFYSNLENINKLTLSELKNNYLVIGNSFIKEELNKYNNLTFYKMPINLNELHSILEKFLFNKKFTLNNIEIQNKILLNKKTNSQCTLTDIENDILIYLLSNKISYKKNIKENILKVKSDIITNSLDSHLTRIRKKLDKINSNLKIQSKMDIISISNLQKN